MTEYLAVARISFLERAAYGADLIARAAMMLLFLFVFASLWGRVMPGDTRFADFDHPAMVWYIVVTEVLMTAVPAVGAKINREVRTGSFVSYLLRPCNYLLFHLASFLGETLVALLVNAAMGMLVACFLVGAIGFSLAQLPVLFLVLLLSLILNFAIMASIALSSFWVEDNQPFFWIYNKFQLILGGVLIPLDFFPDFLASLARAMPFGLMFYAPARLTVAYDWAFASTIIRDQLLWIFLLGILLSYLYSASLRQVNVNGG